MNMKNSTLLAGIGLALSIAMAGSVSAGTPRLDQREHNQRARIHQGVKSGELTRPEARRLRVGEARLHLNEARAKSDGEVTAAERARLQREASRESRRIYRQKHDAQDRG
jgi:hypothetical protein